jgi:plastocyanin
VRSQTADRAKKRLLHTMSPLALAVGLLALTGCGGSSKSTSSTTAAPAAPATTTSATTSSTPATTPAPASGSQTLAAAANPEGLLKFTPASLTAKAGKVTIDFTNSASVEHNLTVESPSKSTVGATPTFQGGKRTVTVNLKPGSYKFFCSVPGHRQAGMEGTLQVK